MVRRALMKSGSPATAPDVQEQAEGKEEKSAATRDHLEKK